MSSPDARYFVRAREDAPEKGPFTLAQIRESHAAKRLGDGAILRPVDGAFEKKTVRELLTAKDDERAAMLVSFARQDVAAAERREAKGGRMTIVLGLACISAGIGLSAVSYSAASESGGGRYALFSGLVVFGIIQVVRGTLRR